MDKQAKFNILVRTSNRPLYFNNCIKSILSQKYDNYNIIISTDDKKDKYVYDYKYPKIKIVENIKIDKKADDAPYNLYFNNMYEYCEKGYILFIDDDDKLTNKFALRVLNKNIQETKSKMLIWRVKFPHNVIPDEDRFFSKKIEAGHISGIGFAFHTDYLNSAKWDSKTMSDYRIIKKLDKEIKNTLWINKVFTEIQRNKGMGGHGDRKDLM